MAKATKRSWDEHVRSWRRSGLSAPMYAEQQGLRPGTLYGWSVRLRRIEERQDARFIEVTQPAAPPRGLELRVGAVVTLRVEPGFDAALLREVVAALVTP